ncbi:MAG: phospho-N-acetylmuramoyl-pentapeptide-transferase, partial [Chloroflexi bacterium]|nr:phospho-N-acetylmuramoyl-pentapeptide-transferase [Chloroflexota bacterium]
ITDGLDGLSAGCGALVAFLMTILLSTGGHPELAAWSAVLTGALLAFLWHNAHPARVFMGDVGAEGLGAALAVLALASGNVLLLLVASLAILAGPGSVTLQVAWFKYTRRRYGQGRRIFRIAPLHHHFERLGLNEVQITVRYWIVTAAACLAALALWGAI